MANVPAGQEETEKSQEADPLMEYLPSLQGRHDPGGLEWRPAAQAGEQEEDPMGEYNPAKQTFLSFPPSQKLPEGQATH